MPHKKLSANPTNTKNLIQLVPNTTLRLFKLSMITPEKKLTTIQGNNLKNADSETSMALPDRANVMSGSKEIETPSAKLLKTAEDSRVANLRFLSNL